MGYPDKLDEWIAGYLRDNLADEDRRKLDGWRSESVDNERLFERLCDEGRWSEAMAGMAAWDKEKGWQAVLAKSNARRRSVWRRWSGVAAGVMLLIGAGCLWHYRGAGDETVGAVGTHRGGVRLSTASGLSFALDTMRDIQVDRLVLENDGKQLVVRPAEKAEEAIGWNTVDVPRGSDYSLILGDGTEIFLNAETELRFPDRFEEGKNREVWVTGEAYFIVQRDETRPFIVHTPETSVRVLGTVFNVMAYADAAEQQITLVSGKVEVAGNEAADKIILTPGLQAVYDKEQCVLESREVDVSYYTAWHEGLFAFRECPLVEVMETLARWYDFEVFFQHPELRNLEYTGKVERHATLGEVLDNFRKTGEFEYEIKGKTVVIK